MTLVAAKCTQCQGNLKIDNTLEAAVCPHCKTPFITEKAINNYNTYNQSTYNIQHADLQVNDEKSIENRLKNAEVFLTKHKDYAKAMELFKEISEDAPDDYRTWWGIVRTGTWEFTRVSTNQGFISDYNKALRVAPEDVKGRLTKTWQEYSKIKIESVNLNNLKNKLNHLIQERDNRYNRIRLLESKLKETEGNISFITFITFTSLGATFIGYRLVKIDSLIALLGAVLILSGIFGLFISLNLISLLGERQKAKRDLTIIRSEIKDIEIRINEKAQIIGLKQKV